MKPDGFKYYEMVLVYVDDILCISHDPKATIRGIQETFKLKDNKIEKPETYLGAQLAQVVIGGQQCWTMSSHEYVKAAVANVEAALDASGQRLPSRCTTPNQSNYRPELDTTPELNLKGMRYYQEQIGVLRWAVELGRIDIAMEVSMLSTHLAAPREGHLQQVYHCFAYLKTKPKRTLAFDSQHPMIDDSSFEKCDLHDFYRGAQKPIPGDAPEPSTHCFVDADHAGNRVTRRSQSGILLFVNRAPILWFSKRQNTVETSTLKKKHNAIAYHSTREAVAAGTIQVTKEDGKTNLAGVLTKPLPQATKELLCDTFMN